MIGKTVNGYTLKQLLHDGVMATVYYAENEWDAPVAIKVLKMTLPDDTKVWDILSEVMEPVVQLSHPNIRKFLGIRSLEGRPAVIMEYLSGKHLGSYVEAYGPIPSEVLEGYWPVVVDALSYGHGEGVLHRDIKPENLFLTESGELKILDFGMANIWDILTYLNLSQMVAELITMSPEQMLQPSRVERETDYYSLGFTFYYLLSGHNPYNKAVEPGFMIQMRILKEPLDLQGLPEHWQGLLSACLKKKPSERKLLLMNDVAQQALPEEEATLPEKEIIPMSLRKIRRRTFTSTSTRSRGPSGGRLWAAIRVILRAGIPVR